MLLPLVLGCSMRWSSADAEARSTASGAVHAAGNDSAQRHSASAPERSPSGPAASQGGRTEREPGVRLLFVGNSFTLQGPVPDLVAEFAEHCGFVNVKVDVRAVSGQSLAWHRADTSPEGAPARLREGWDVVVLQDYSTRPTEALGDPDEFKEDVTWFYERAKEANPSARVVLYETWARRVGHPIYEVAFGSPAQMQAQLRRNYLDAAERYVPRFASVAPGDRVEVAPVGDAWELQLGRNPDLRLHAPDDYHASALGQYLSAAVLFSTLFDHSASGLPSMGISPRVARSLQASADAVTGHAAPATPLPRPTDRPDLPAA